MIKRITILLTITSMLLLSACSIVGSRVAMLNEMTEEKKIAERMEQIMLAIKNEDTEAMKKLFSKQALDEIEDFESDFEYLINFFQGEVKPWEKGSWSSFGSIRDGKKSLKIKSEYIIVTDEDTYIFYIIDYAENTIDPNNEGLYTLRVIRAEDKDKEFAYWGDMGTGIYNPEE